ncbi:MAG: hypothetical protein CVU47_07925 [Chloroflexi bacterium HGW-Chloroflexi-9]|nr:MAG: hypothetical protein CVU47_07925 [Chloroflexi bacterium HGW-Chloroflexi-9]
MLRRVFLSGFLLLAAFTVACSGDETPATTPAPTASAGTATEVAATPTPEPRTITFMAGFRPQANLPFAAVYVAEAEGFFAEEGLTVDIQHSSGQDEHLKFLLEGSVTVTTGTAAQAVRRVEQDLPVVAVALFGQRGDQGYVARADAGITGPADFAGKSVGFKAGVVPAELLAMLGGVGLTPDDIELVSVGFDPRVFIEGQVDIYPVFLNNEPDTIRSAGTEITVIDPHDFDVPTLGLTYLVTRATLADGDLVERFLRATMRATAWIEANPDAAVAIVLKHAEGADAAHQRFLLDTELANARRGDGMGRATLDQWQALADLLLQYEVITSEVDVAQVFDGAVIDGLYERGEIK